VNAKSDYRRLGFKSLSQGGNIACGISRHRRIILRDFAHAVRPATAWANAREIR